jgi:hypothetical protein
LASRFWNTRTSSPRRVYGGQRAARCASAASSGAPVSTDARSAGAGRRAPAGAAPDARQVEQPVDERQPYAAAARRWVRISSR